MNNRNDSTNSNGKEYVTIAEFTRRVDASRRTVERRIAEGTIPTTKIDGRKHTYIEWESGKDIWYMLRHDPQRSAAGKVSHKNRNKEKTEDKYAKVSEEPKTPVISSPSVPSIDIEEIAELDIQDLSSFDKEKYADCLLPNNEFDYDKLKVRLTAETYQQKLQKERGQLVEKTEIISWAKKLGVMVNTGLESIPQKYTAVLIAQCQGIIARRLGKDDFEFTEQERTEIRSTLKDCGPEIMKSIKLMIMEMEEE